MSRDFFTSVTPVDARPGGRVIVETYLERRRAAAQQGEAASSRLKQGEVASSRLNKEKRLPAA